MIFAKLDVDFYDHPRFIAAGLPAIGLWAVALAYVRKHAYDRKRPGWFPKDADFLRRAGAAQAAKKLVEVGLWIDRGDCYEIHNYEAKNEGTDEIDLRRAADRARKAAERDRKRLAALALLQDVSADASALGHVTSHDGVPGVVPGSPSGSSLSGQGERERERPPDPDRALVDLDALEQGVSVATGAACHFDRRWREIAAWCEIFGRCHTDEGADRAAFLRAEGTRWAAWCKGKNMAPNRMKFADWLNLGAPDAEQTQRRTAGGRP